MGNFRMGNLDTEITDLFLPPEALVPVARDRIGMSSRLDKQLLVSINEELQVIFYCHMAAR